MITEPFEPITEPRAVGWPWHGFYCVYRNAGGMYESKLVVNGKEFDVPAGVIPNYPPLESRKTMLFRSPDAGEPMMLTNAERLMEAKRGREWLPYAVVSGKNSWTYGDSTHLWGRGWLYIDPAGHTWRAALTQVRDNGLPYTAWVELARGLYGPFGSDIVIRLNVPLPTAAEHVEGGEFNNIRWVDIDYAANATRLTTIVDATRRGHKTLWRTYNTIFEIEIPDTLDLSESQMEPVQSVVLRSPAPVWVNRYFDAYTGQYVDKQTAFQKVSVTREYSGGAVDAHVKDRDVLRDHNANIRWYANTTEALYLPWGTYSDGTVVYIDGRVAVGAGTVTARATYSVAAYYDSNDVLQFFTDSYETVSTYDIRVLQRPSRMFYYTIPADFTGLTPLGTTHTDTVSVTVKATHTVKFGPLTKKDTKTTTVSSWYVADSFSVAAGERTFPDSMPFNTSNIGSGLSFTLGPSEFTPEEGTIGMGFVNARLDGGQSLSTPVDDRQDTEVSEAAWNTDPLSPVSGGDFPLDVSATGPLLTKRRTYTWTPSEISASGNNPLLALTRPEIPMGVYYRGKYVSDYQPNAGQCWGFNPVTYEILALTRPTTPTGSGWVYCCYI